MASSPEPLDASPNPTEATLPKAPRPVRYWPDGAQVTLDVEEALDRIVETVERVQAKMQAP
jgi:hypothetical protein